MDFRKYALAAAVVILIWGLWLFWLWQPDRQVRLHTTHFLKKVGGRNWEAAGRFMADDFTDRWGHNRATALQDAREVFQQFIFVTIENRTDQCDVRGSEGTTQTYLKINGQGTQIGALVMQTVNGLHAPFFFTWRKVGSAPWNWQLVHVDQSELNLNGESPF